MAPKAYTLEDLLALDIERRRALYLNAQRLPEGRYIVDLIEQNGLPLSSGGLTMDDPVYREIVDIVWSWEGQAAALAAQGQGYPALCGVDRLLRTKLGDRYGKHDQGTVAAGSVVGEVMRHKGYKKGRSKPCPVDCTAKSGAMWTKR